MTKKAAKAGRAATHLKLITHDGVRTEEAEPAEKDYSHISTDMEALRTPQSDTAREVAAAAKNALGTIKTLQQGRSDVFRMNPYDLYTKPGWNVRDMTDPETLAHIDWLARHIAENGVQEPYRVYHENGRFYIANGHLRQHAVFHAINNLGAKIMTVPVRLGPAGENEVDRAMTMLSSNSGKKLSEWEEGTLMKRFIGWGWEVGKIADKFGCSKAQVYQKLDLQALPDPVAALVRNNPMMRAHYAISEFKSNDGDVDATVKELQSAIRAATWSGAKRVMPKHGLKARLSGKGRAVGGGRLNEILVLIRNLTVWKDNSEGRWLASMTREDGERLVKLAGMAAPE